MKDHKPWPLCNEYDFTYIRDYGLERFLKGVQVWCSYKKDGCEWKGKLGELELYTSESKSISRKSAERVSVCGGRVHTRVWVPASPHH